MEESDGSTNDYANLENAEYLAWEDSSSKKNPLSTRLSGRGPQREIESERVYRQSLFVVDGARISCLFALGSEELHLFDMLARYLTHLLKPRELRCHYRPDGEKMLEAD